MNIVAMFLNYVISNAMKLHGSCKLQQQCTSTIKIRNEQHMSIPILQHVVYIYILTCCKYDERQAYRLRVR